ncbi:GRAM domain-containing 1C isoform X2 [Brachionus plicatilis]|uniref:GRAM domain-containing 1C isoform X2 n=1 Tax=Brachionus plicatilis TaxID=10195 RepID=A0A3M7PH37_BRAPC|nr:GRAM domain-containing 1C isoform X2 [Brachionus plicatilis]
MSIRSSSQKKVKAKNHLNTICEYKHLKSNGYDPDDENKFGRVLINDSFDLPILYLFECLFEYNRFYQEYTKLIDIFNFNAGNWTTENNYKIKTNEFEVKVGGIIGNKICKNREHVKIIKQLDEKYFIIEAETSSSGIMYVDCFNLRYTFWLINDGEKKTILIIRGIVRYLQKPNYFIRSLIEKSCYEGLQQNFLIMSNHLKREANFQEFSCDNESSLSESDQNLLNFQRKLPLKATKSILSRTLSTNSRQAGKEKLSAKKSLSLSGQNSLFDTSKIIFESESNLDQNLEKNSFRYRSILVYFIFMTIFLVYLNLMLYKRLLNIEKTASRLLNNPVFINSSNTLIQ